MKTKFNKESGKFQVIGDDNKILEEYAEKKDARNRLYEIKREHKKAIAEAKRIETEKNQKPVKEITITIEWKKSYMWGHNPHCEASIQYHDGTWHNSQTYTASGCGYDKESTVIADVFNDYLKYKLWQLPEEARHGGNGSNDKGKAPYGILLYKDERPHYGGGIGIGCYYKIAEYIGGKFEKVAEGKTFDVFKYTDNCR